MEKHFSKKDELNYMLEISEKLNIPFIRISQYQIPKELLNLIPEKIARNYKVIPVAKFGPVLTLAMVNPLNLMILDELRYLIGLEITPVVSTPSEILEAIEIYYKPSFEMSIEKLKEEKTEEVSIEKTTAEEEELDIYKLTEMSSQEKVVNTLNNIILEALKSKASDIHIEPYQEHIRIRYRIDGVLTEKMTLSKDMQDALLARIKIMSKLDITQRKIPQDGRFTINFEDRNIDFRVSILPTYFGEKGVLRILDKGRMKLDLGSLGFSERAFEIYKEAIFSPFGIILITGPTGSGKSTTLYSMLNELNTPEKNIVTIEDPIEYHLKGITQIQIKPEIGLDFAQCLRSVLRQSPDVIMVGEIRDFETADIAMKSALTGHLVLTTLHTNDAPSAITRLLDMGIEPFLIAGALRMVSAQRLVRKLCDYCKESYTIDKRSLEKFGIFVDKEEVVLYRATGCNKCGKVGYKGREAIVEVFLVDDTLREMIIQRTPLLDIKKYLKSTGMHTLREDGFLKALKGVTSLEEVIRVTAQF